jgi:hypothetical protein
LTNRIFASSTTLPKVQGTPRLGQDAMQERIRQEGPHLLLSGPMAGGQPLIVYKSLTYAKPDVTNPP